jgi:hypothetical protein
MGKHQGCNLPIQLWYLGRGEMSNEMIDLLMPLGVQCVDALEIQKIHSCRILRGWEVKAYSIVHAPFREILFLDADNLAMRDPEYLFDTESYRSTGALFWPDHERFDSDHIIWRICGIAYADEPQFESAQIVVDKQRCWKPLQLALWYNEQSDFFYRRIHGDKDTFHMAFRKLNKPYSMAHLSADDHFGQFHHRDPCGNLIFVHRKKWQEDEDDQIRRGFPNEELCFEFSEELKTIWGGNVGG